MRISSVMVLALGAAAYEETAMLQVKDHGDEPAVKPVKYTKEKVEKVQKYTKSARGDGHVDVVLPDPVWLKHSEDSSLVMSNCHVQGAKKCSALDGGEALMASMKDDTQYGYSTAHYGGHCCVEKVQQCETKFVTRCNRKRAKDLTQAQCEKLAERANPLSFQRIVEKKNQFPGCHYRKADGKTFWNSFVADGFAKGDGSHGDRKDYAPICRIRRCKKKKTEYTKVVEHKAYKKVAHPAEHKKVEHLQKYQKVEHPEKYEKVEHPKKYEKVEHTEKYEKVEHPKQYQKVEHPKEYKKVEHPKEYKKVGHPKAYVKVEHPKAYKKVKVEHPKAYKKVKVEHPKEYKKLKAEHPKEYKKVKAEHPKEHKKAEHPKEYKKAAHPKKYKKAEHPKKVEHPKKYKNVEEPRYHN